MDIPVAANVLGTLGAVCWSVQLIPQIIINYWKHDTTGLQPTMMLLWACAGVPLGVYNIVENFNVALQIQPQILTFLSLITWIQCKYYGNEWPMAKSLAIAIPVAICMGGIELGLIFALRHAKNRHLQWPTTLMAVLSACFLCAGVLRHYWDIYKERTVRGISFIFVFIDAMGDLTSLISVFFQPNLNVLGMIIYGSELVLWTGVFACGGYYNFKPWLRRKRSRRRGQVIQIASTGAGGEHSEHVEETGRVDPEDSTTVFRTASVTSRDGHEDNDHELRLRTARHDAIT